MAIMDTGNSQPSTSLPTAGFVARAMPWGLGAALVLTTWAGYTSSAARSEVSSLEARVADIGQQHGAVEAQLQHMAQEHRQLTAGLSTATERAEANAAALEETRRLASELQRAHRGTARTAVANAAELKTVREDLGGQVSAVGGRVTVVADDVTTVKTTLSTTRAAVGDLSRDVTARTTRIADQVAKNASDLAALRLKGERNFLEFDIRKNSSPESWTVGDVRIQLKKADVRRSTYDVIIHADDGQTERKERTMNEPVPFLVGSNQLRYELVVTAVEKDRIRGYVSVPKDPQPSATH